MRRHTIAGTCLLSVVLAISGQTAFGQSQQRGGSSSSSGGSYGSSSNTYGTSSTSSGTSSRSTSTSSGSTSTYGTSSNTYGTSSNTYGTSNNTYGTSSNTYGTSRNTYGRSSNTYGTPSYRTEQPRYKDRSPTRLYLPILLAGRVIIEGAEGLPEAVIIRISCGGQSLPQDYTDRKGRFAFQPSCNPVLAMSDASARVAFFGRPGTPLGVGPAGLNLSHCWLYADLAGYRSSRLWLGMTRPMRRSNVGTIVLTRIEGSSGSPVSFTTLTAPKKAKKAYEKAAKLLRSVEEPDYAKAIPLLERAVQLHPEFAAAWEALGRARQGGGDSAGARVAFGRAIRSDSRFLKPYPPLIEMAVADEDWTKLESLTDRYLAMAPGASEFRFYNSFAALKAGKLSKAESMVKMIEDAGEIESWPMSNLVLAGVHSARADFERAADIYEKFLSDYPNSPASERIMQTLNDWSALEVIDSVDLDLTTVWQPSATAKVTPESVQVVP